jgi:hypothetical protein
MWLIEFLNDSSTDGTIFNSAFSNGYENGATKYLSGIQYYTSPLKFQHNQQANNIYKNTYYPDSDAGTFTDETAIDNSPIYNAGVGIDGNYQTNSPIAGSLQVAFTPDGGAFQALDQPDNVDSFFIFNSRNDFLLIKHQNFSLKFLKFLFIQSFRPNFW